MRLTKKSIQTGFSYCSVEGNIGAGKTTFLRAVFEKLHMHIVREPVDKWQRVSGGGNLLEHFYRDPSRWAYTFQSYAAITRIQEQQLQKNASAWCITERSIFSDRYCFAENLFEQGRMAELEWELYQELFSWSLHSLTTPPKGFIYLRVDPNVCYERISKRARGEEQSISLEYLRSIHQKHEDWLVSGHTQESDIPVLILECNQDFLTNESYMTHLISQVRDFCNHLAIVS